MLNYNYCVLLQSINTDCYVRLCIMIHVVVALVTGTVCFDLNISPLDTILLLR